MHVVPGTSTWKNSISAKASVHEKTYGVRISCTGVANRPPASVILSVLGADQSITTSISDLFNASPFIVGGSREEMEEACRGAVNLIKCITAKTWSKSIISNAVRRHLRRRQRERLLAQRREAQERRTLRGAKADAAVKGKRRAASEQAPAGAWQAADTAGRIVHVANSSPSDDAHNGQAASDAPA